MKIFTNRNLIQKVILAFVCVTLLEFCMAPSVVKAETSWGGELMGAMRDFITAVADVAISVVQLGLTGKWINAVDEAGTGKPEIEDGYFDEPGDFRYPIIQISPELIFSNQIRLLDANFIRGGSRSSYLVDTEGSETAIDALRRVIASWYVTLRTIAIIGLLSVLIYIGIRIIISSTSQDKAKYKQRLMDWVIAFCLLFFMHYIMAGVLGVIDRINDALSTACGINTESDIQGIELNPDYGGVEYTPSETLGGASSNPIENLINWIKGEVVDKESAMEKARQIIADNGYTLLREEPDPGEDTGSPYSDVGDIAKGWVITEKDDGPLFAPGRIYSIPT